MINWTKARDTCSNGHEHTLFTAMQSANTGEYLCPHCDCQIFKNRSDYEKQLEEESLKKYEME